MSAIETRLRFYESPLHLRYGGRVNGAVVEFIAALMLTLREASSLKPSLAAFTQRSTKIILNAPTRQVRAAIKGLPIALARPTHW